VRAMLFAEPMIVEESFRHFIGRKSMLGSVQGGQRAARAADEETVGHLNPFLCVVEGASANVTGSIGESNDETGSGAGCASKAQLAPEEIADAGRHTQSKT